MALAAFVAWELRRTDPLLDVRLFPNPRFSAASGAIALAFFGLFGFIFMITQYFQVVRGYATLRAGVATLPFAARHRRAVSPLAIVLMHKVGTKVVVTGGPADDDGRLRGRRRRPVWTRRTGAGSSSRWC